jgi:NHL repeat
MNAARDILIRIGRARGGSASDRDLGLSRGPGALVVGVSRALVVVLVVASVLFAVVAVAEAAPRDYLGQLTEADGSALVSPYGVAVDSSDSVWVSDTGTSLVSRFDWAGGGGFLAQGDGSGAWSGSPYIEGLAYGETAGLAYVADSNLDDVWGLNPDGSFAGVQLSSGLGGGCCLIRVAVDNSGGPNDGDLYVTPFNPSGGAPAVVRVDASGAPSAFSASESYVTDNALTGAPDHAFSSPNAVAVDGDGDIYVADSNLAVVDRFDSSGTFVRSYASADFTAIRAVAVDPTNGNVLVGDSGTGAVHEFAPDGTELAGISGASTPAGSMRPEGIAVDSTGTVYVADAANGAVEIFAPAAPAALITYAAPSEVTQTSVTLNASVDPAGTGDITGCEFQYGTGEAYGESVACDQAPPFTSPTEVSGAIAGLVPGTNYHYRLRVTNADGPVNGPDRTFRAPTPPTVDGSPPFVPRVSATGATLSATVDPQGTETAYRFEYGTDTSYGQSTPTASAGQGLGDTPVTADVGGLEPATVYHFRVIANNGTGGDIVGADQTFVTAPAAAAGAIDVGTKTATLTGTVNSRGVDGATYHFEYGATTAYDQSTPEADVSAGSEDQQVDVAVSGLAPATTYHVRVVATIEGQTVVGAGGTFTTLPAPAVALGAVTDIGARSAVLHASTDTHGLGGSYRFTVLGIDNPHTATTAAAAVPADGQLTAAITGLSPGGRYEVVLTVTAAGASTESRASFATPGLAPFVSPLRPFEDLDPYSCAALANCAGPATANRFVIRSARVRNARRSVTLTLTVSKPGVIRVKHRYLKPVRKTIRAGTTTLKLTLSRAGRKALRNSPTRRLRLGYAVRYTTPGESSQTVKRTLTFTRKASR